MVWAGFVACVPKHAAAEYDGAAARWHVDVVGSVTTIGVELPAFEVHRSFDADTQHGRAYSDGSHIVGVKWGETILTTRLFPDGTILAIGPLAAASRTIPGIESYDWLWLALFPAPWQEDGRVATKFPLWVLGTPHVTVSVSGQGERRAGTRRMVGTVAWESRDLQADASVEVGTNLRQPGSQDLVVDRTVRTRPGVAQHVNWSVAVTPVGPAAPFLAPPRRGDGTREHDGDPIQRIDGTPIADLAVDPLVALPYLLLPDDLTADQRAALHARFVAPATIAVPAGSP